MNRERLKQVHPDLASEIEDILWHGYDSSVVIIEGKQEFVGNSMYGITKRTRGSFFNGARKFTN